MTEGRLAGVGSTYARDGAVASESTRADDDERWC